MQKKYPNLQDLLNDDTNAQNYYSKLPDYVKDQMSKREHNINSLASLQDYAENLLRGDN